MIILGLGSNIGERLQYLEFAIKCLSESVLSITAISPIYESPALLKEGAPEEWRIDFLNMAVRGETKLSPQELLLEVKTIEQKIGRQDRGVWAPREIDIDILAYGSSCINQPNLTIPHAALCQRPFALLPFVDIAYEWVYPVEGEYKGKTSRDISYGFGPHDTKLTQYKIKPIVEL